VTSLTRWAVALRTPPPGTHVENKQELRHSHSPQRTVGKTKICESAARREGRRRRRNRACHPRLDESHVSRDPEADRVVLLRRPQARQGTH